MLTLTATPIPRTLHMALTGIRDMSTIETPPEDRLPIQTYVTEFDDHLVREAILRELERGGQVFFVHNRVHNIELIATTAARRRAGGRVAVGHGQMHEDQLEKVMVDFAAGQGRRAGLHHDHRVRPRHPEREHDHHQPRRPASGWRSSTSCAGASGAARRARTPTCCTRSTAR